MGMKLCCMQNKLGTDYRFSHDLLNNTDEDEERAVCEVAYSLAKYRRKPLYESAKMIPRQYNLRPNDLHEDPNTFLATHVKTGVTRQLVMHKKPSLPKIRKRLKQHINKILDLKCHDVSSVFEVYEDYKNIYMIQERLSGGTVAERILAREYFTEQETAVLIKHMLLDIQKLHQADIYHGNLYPGSFRFLNDSPSAPLKLDDFGLSLKINRWNAHEENIHSNDSISYAPLFETCKLVFVAPEFAPAYHNYRKLSIEEQGLNDNNAIISNSSKNGIQVDNFKDILSTAIESHMEWEDIMESGFVEENNKAEGAVKLKGRKGFVSDVWSLGTIAFLFLCGYPPFFAPLRNSILGRVHRHDFSFDAPFWSKISEEGKDFIRSCLKPQFYERTTIDQALEHPWIQYLAADSPSGSMFTSFMLNLRRFHRTSVLETFSANAMAQVLSPLDLVTFLTTAKRIDSSETGFFTFQELRSTLCHLGYEQLAELLYTHFEMNARYPGDSYLDYRALIDAVKIRQSSLFEEYAWQAFSRNIDWEGDVADPEPHVPLNTVSSIVGRPTLQKILEQCIGKDLGYNTREVIHSVENKTDGNFLEQERPLKFTTFLNVLMNFVTKEC